MIVPMKKVSLILPASQKESFLAELQKAGLIQIDEQTEKVSKALEEKIELYYKVRRAVADLRRARKKRKYFKGEELTGNPVSILKEYDRLHESLGVVTREIEKLEFDEAKIRPWGNFRMEEIERLREYGVDARFYIIGIKKFRALDLTNVAYEIIRQDKKFVYIVVFSREKISIPENEVSLPRESLENIARRIFQAVKEREILETGLLDCTQYEGVLSRYVTELQNSISFDRANLHCDNDESGHMTVVHAWVEKNNEAKITEVFDRYPVWYEIREPEAGENPPVMLRNNWFVRPFEAITRIFSLPSYFEMDPTPLFAPFFMLFFGLCIADVGYALILLLGLVFAYFKSSAEFRPILKLSIILGVFTMIAGYWLNTFFGYSIYANPGLPDAFLKMDTGADFLAPYMAEGKLIFPAMTFSMILGFAQVAFGILLSMITRWKESGFKFALQPFSYILLMHAAVLYGVHEDMMGMGSLQVGQFNLGAFLKMTPAITPMALLGAGLFLLVFFNNPDKKIWIRPPLALWEMYGFVSGLIGDILSYLRLFALGLSGGLLGGAFNNIAFMVMKSDEGYSVIGIIFGVLIMVLGHSLNIVLSIMGAFVHSLRLTFVEFYKNLQFKGGGKPFTPFIMHK